MPQAEASVDKAQRRRRGQHRGGRETLAPVDREGLLVWGQQHGAIDRRLAGQRRHDLLGALRVAEVEGRSAVGADDLGQAGESDLHGETGVLDVAQDDGGAGDDQRQRGGGQHDDVQLVPDRQIPEAPHLSRSFPVTAG